MEKGTLETAFEAVSEDQFLARGSEKFVLCSPSSVVGTVYCVRTAVVQRRSERDYEYKAGRKIVQMPRPLWPRQPLEDPQMNNAVIGSLLCP